MTRKLIPMPLDDSLAPGPVDDDLPRRLRIADVARKVLDTPDDPSPAPFEKHIVEDGVQLALDGDGHVLAVMEDVLPSLKRFALRRSTKKTGGDVRSTEWVYVELADGLRIYMSANGVVISRVDINP